YTSTLANFPLNHCYICVMVIGAPKPPLGTRCGPFRAGDPRRAFGVRGRDGLKREANMAERLSAEARKSALAELTGWSETPGREAIGRTFTFKDFNEAFGFMSRSA